MCEQGATSDLGIDLSESMISRAKAISIGCSMPTAGATLVVACRGTGHPTGHVD
jgi:hypothetical protein